MRRLPLLALPVALSTLAACDDTPSAPTAEVLSATGQAATRSDDVPFPVWRQSFQYDVEGWITDDIGGPDGWCGDIHRVTRTEASNGSGPAPSTGLAHATVAWGACNAFWQELGFGASGPYSHGAGYYPLPAGGYTTELDVWLDPGWTPAEVFTYALSVLRLDLGYPDGLLYTFVPVTTSGGSLYVAGEEVDEAGWYTFRHTVASEGGELTIRFDLLRGGLPVAGHAVTELYDLAQAAFSVAGLDPSMVGNGYIWFAWIQPGLELAIDEHVVRPGR